MAEKTKTKVQSADADTMKKTTEENSKKTSESTTHAKEEKAKAAPKTRKKAVKEVVEAVPVEPTKRKIPKAKTAKTDTEEKEETDTAAKKTKKSASKAEQATDNKFETQDKETATNGEGTNVNPFAKYDEIIEEDEKKKSVNPKKATKTSEEPLTSDNDDNEEAETKSETASARPKSSRRKQKEEVIEEFMIDDSSASIASLTKGNVWGTDVDEIYDMLIEGRRTEHWAENEVHYMNIIRPVFDIRFFNKEDELQTARLETEGFKTFPYPATDKKISGIAIRKHKINKITDLTMENVLHLEAYEVLKLIKENMGTGWKGLPLSIQDIIETAFYVDQSSLPEAVMHRAGGIIDRRKEDGYEVLEIPRGNWIEAVFLKYKPRMEKIRFESISTRLGKSDDEDIDNDDDIDDETEDEVDNELDMEDEDEDENIDDEPTQIEDFEDIPDGDDEED